MFYRRIFCWQMLLTLALLAVPSTAVPQENGQIPTIEEKTAGMTHMEGYFDLFWENNTGKLYLEIDKWDVEFLYGISLAAGLGSNPVGLDRGQLGGNLILAAHRVGPKVLLVQPNYRYRALTSDSAVRGTVRDAFAPSTHWGFDIAAQSGSRVLVDGTDFFMRDAHHVIQTLERSQQGRFSIDRSRSVLYMPRTKNFPLNTEIEASLTFTSDSPGQHVRSAAASGEAFTLRVHHSFIQLPDDDYTPRKADPRVSAQAITFNDYATPVDERLAVQWIRRHRIKKQNPNAEMSPPVEPIVYYVDPGTPEPIRTALVEGGRWWNQAFEAAGFIDGFRVEVLPEGADPQDIRYNMVHWSPRSTRGWSYGNSVTDPRTGEILKGNVNLGALRIRQDFLLGSGMVGPFGSDGGPNFNYLAQVSGNSDALEMAMARIRQLSAHEIGHCIGFGHNYEASTYMDRASVMEYPAPLVLITNGQIDLSTAYTDSIGEFDKFVVNYSYREFTPGTDEDAALEEIILEAQDRGIRFMASGDGRADGAHPLTTAWDNGEDPVEWLRHEMRVRQIGLENFSDRMIRAGEPMAGLEEVLLPLYLHHRFQVESASKSIGGASYVYAVKGDTRTPITIVPPEQQLNALDAVLETITPEALAIPERILRMIPPRAFGMASGERFQHRTGHTFDALGVAATAAELSLGLVFMPARTARLIEFHARDTRNPSLNTVVERVLAATWQADAPRDSYLAEVQRTAQRVALDMLMEHASSASSIPQVRAILNAKVGELAGWLETLNRDPHQQLALEDIRRWQTRPEGLHGPSETPTTPQGAPIGSWGERGR
ncbi:zinc-dependent metalloprotease [Gemmatimonadota bacterium]